MDQALFGTDGIRKRMGQWPLTPAGLWAVGYGIGSFLKSRKLSLSVIIGHDTRDSCAPIQASLSQGLKAHGVEVYYVGIVPTPAVSFLTPKLQASMGLMISASHNPAYYNGLKFFNALGEKISEEEEALLKEAIMQAPPLPQEPLSCPSLTHDSTLYEDFLSSLIPSLSGLKIVLDCAHGSLSWIAPRVLRRCGAQVAEVLGAEPTGTNINAQVGSLYPEALQQAVCTYQADLGMGFDGDGDRLIIVDSQGGLQDGDQILACLALQREIPGVVGTLMSNLGLEHFLQSRNLSFVRSEVGDRRIAEKLRALDWPLGGEPSGHLIDRQFLPTGDGLLSGLMVASHVARYGNPFPLFTPTPSVQRNIPLFMPNILEQEELKAFLKSVRLTFEGRILLRLSGTEPLLRLLIEGPDLSLAKKTADQLESYVMRTQHASGAL